MATNKNRDDGDKNSSIMGYFRAIFRDEPDLLHSRSNDVVIEKWLADHPEHKEIPRSVRNTLANLKSLLRKKEKVRRAASADGDGHLSRLKASRGHSDRHTALETLEAHIDEALSEAKLLDREGLAVVIKLLHRARNEVVWMLGQ